MDLTGLSFAAMRQIERVRAAAELTFLTIVSEPGPVPRPDGDGSYTLHRHDGSDYGYRSREHRLEEAALEYVLSIFHAVVEAVRGDATLPAQARSIADRLWQELLTDTYRDKHPRHTAADLFVARAADARLHVPWWQTFHVALETRLLTPPTFGQQLRALMAAAKWLPADLVRETGFDRKTVDAHLADTATPRRENVSEYEGLFTKRLGHPVMFER